VTLNLLPDVIRRMEERIESEAPPEEAEMLWAATYLLMGLKYRLAAIVVAEYTAEPVAQMQEVIIGLISEFEPVRSCMIMEDDVEMRWIHAWNEVYAIVGERWNVQCLLPDGQILDPEACRGWLQEMVYEGWFVKVESGWVLGKPGIVVSRWKE
jgi:hypothetical protein